VHFNSAGIKVDERNYLIKFKDLALDEALLRAIDAAGYTTPTPIQSDVIPAILEGHDILGIAQTGTGKTASFVLPLLQKILADGARAKPKTCQTLILTPTRELASQIAENIGNYAKFTKISVAVVVGGVKPKPQIRALTPGVDIVVATPGRLLDHVNAGVLSLDKTTAVVLDEADQMLDLGFMPTIRKIMKQLPVKRQTAMMSATMPPPIRKLTAEFQTNPVEITVAAVSKPIERIAQSVQHVPAGNKSSALSQILLADKPDCTIVFTRTKRGADKVCRQLGGAGLSAVAIHGNKSQSQREKALAAFRDREIKVLVATDIAARGIDIDDVSLVINYDLPHVSESYVHRIGRTARAGRSGKAISLCDPTEQDLLKSIEKLIGTQLHSENEPLAPIQKPKADKKKASSNGQRSEKAEVGSRVKRRRRRSKPGAGKTDHTKHPSGSSNDSMAGLNRMLAKTGGRPKRKPSSSSIR